MFSSQSPNSLRKFAWNSYNSDISITNKNIPNQTFLFFERLPSCFKSGFYVSSLPIIQFGIAKALYVQKFSDSRKIIGYDFSDVAIQALNTSNKISARKIDLNQINHTDNSLAYLDLLKIDFSNPADVLLIRILEYMEPEAVKLLMISLCNLAQAGTRFYFEIFNSEHSGTELKPGFIFDYNVSIGWISSFFNPWPDFTTTYYNVSYNEEQYKNTGEKTSIEKMIVEKTSQSPYLDDSIEYQTNTHLISSVVQLSFTARLKPNYYVDATLDVSNHSQSEKETFTEKLKSLTIPHRFCLFGEKQYLVIPHVNVREATQEYIPRLKKN
jgi:hypothetical protein